MAQKIVKFWSHEDKMYGNYGKNIHEVWRSYQIRTKIFKVFFLQAEQPIAPVREQKQRFNIGEFVLKHNIQMFTKMNKYHWW